MVAAVVAGSLMIADAPASASCVTPPPVSPVVFTGTVLSTAHDGLVATVRTDDGRTVEVRGNQSESGFTTVDRTFAAGVHYEFHPVNSVNPFRDNICTATRVLVQVSTTATAAVPASAAAEEASDGGLLWLVGGAGVIALVVLGAVLFWSRKSGRRTRD
ncbi:hypothetical protein [Amycolatopsis sp. SID8362]|uniref:hypothetical protein n=1 Tax=Amycolatopsis sp. SID8362 TaxID=2690346 RepID=UPI00136800A3|nr:hypothetical protein [Amycolatopsis sp. SID8362]NBH03466.1 hypothetical protein [Amycolatopsis sp. SID8362]